MQINFVKFTDFHTFRIKAPCHSKCINFENEKPRKKSMKIAIPVFQTKISPRFDSAQSFLLMLIKNDGIVTREELPMMGWSLSAKRKELVKRDVDTVICGGIDMESMQYLCSGGIKVYSWITGEIEDAVTRFIDKGLESGIIIGARGRRKGQWRFCTREDHFCNAAQTAFRSVGEGVNVMPKGNRSGTSGKGADKGKGCSKAGQGSGRGRGRGAGQCQNQDIGTGQSRSQGKGMGRADRS